MPARDLENFKSTCKVDICVSEDFAKSAMDNLLDICGDKAATDGATVETNCERMAEIEENLTGKAPVCETGRTFDGCATECSYKTCDLAIENSKNFKEADSCEGTRNYFTKRILKFVFSKVFLSILL